MKKYILVFESEIVYRYQELNPMIFGGPWHHAVSIEVPEDMNLETAQIEIQDGEIVLVEAE